MNSSSSVATLIMDAPREQSRTKDGLDCRRASVQDWVNQITPQQASLDEKEPNSSAESKTEPAQDDSPPPSPPPPPPSLPPPPPSSSHDCQDDLTLGADAKLLKEEAADSTLHAQTAERSPKMKDSLKLTRMASFSSDMSTKTFDSVDQLLNHRTRNPEELLCSLGFGSMHIEQDNFRRIPQRFFRYSSSAQGMTLTDVLELNPELKEYLLSTGTVTSDPVTAKAVLRRMDTMESLVSENPVCHFSKIAGVVTAINRFASNARYCALKQQALDGNRQALRASPHECIAKNGEKFVSILHPDNAQFLNDQGLHKAAFAKAVTRITRPKLGLSLTKHMGSLTEVVQQLKEQKKDEEPNNNSHVVSDLNRLPRRFCGAQQPETSASESGSFLSAKVPERFLRTPSPCVMEETGNPLVASTEHQEEEGNPDEGTLGKSIVEEADVPQLPVKSLLKRPQLSEAVQQSFELEEVQSSDLAPEKPPMIRSSSGHSDSSGFADADQEEASLVSLNKVALLGSSAESDDSKVTVITTPEMSATEYTDQSIQEIMQTFNHEPINVIDRSSNWELIEAKQSSTTAPDDEDWELAEQRMGVGVPGMGRITRVRHRARLEAQIKLQRPPPKKARSVSFYESGLTAYEDEVDVRSRSKSVYASVSREGRAAWWSVLPDPTYHQVLSLLVKTSRHYDPSQGGTCWPVMRSPSRAGIKQHLVEEARLMQQALHKYKMELRSLDLRFSSILDRTDLDEDQRDGVSMLSVMRQDILQEVLEMERLLSARMRRMLTLEMTAEEAPPIDMGGLHIIHMMTELLKEQVYHSNLMSTLSAAPSTSSEHPLLAELEQRSQDAHHPSLIEQISLLKSQLVTSQSQTVASLADSMKELRNSLVEEIRSSVHCETQQLRLQMQSTEQQLSQLKGSISAPATPLSLSPTSNDKKFSFNAVETQKH
ncbi:hypothetical protein CAPTEDRAFT_221244 [Capitella teleta]|uniref:ITPR-interacting domain-containing protein n=1 Tax=Capitella teleta TaxID=283909 RepID=R7U7R3_CAPTE|nr:hypothetical protein CAPTEDRAFT_221244 [Capitella teleta]|eukprot:ELU01994.1 hypothetical protein CAPTEDRAFT_221244 [Capitella teleta]